MKKITKIIFLLGVFFNLVSFILSFDILVGCSIGWFNAFVWSTSATILLFSEGK